MVDAVNQTVRTSTNLAGNLAQNALNLAEAPLGIVLTKDQQVVSLRRSRIRWYSLAVMTAVFTIIVMSMFLAFNPIPFDSGDIVIVAIMLVLGILVLLWLIGMVRIPRLRI